MSKASKRVAVSGVTSAGLLSLALLLPQPATAASAFAAGVPHDVATQGVAFGEGHQFPARAGAEAAALTYCRTTKGVSDEAHHLCKIIGHFDNRCLSVTVDPKPGTPGWGWAIADTQVLANAQAMAMCRKSSDTIRGLFCIVVVSACDGSAFKN